MYQFNKGNNKITELRTILQRESDFIASRTYRYQFNRQNVLLVGPTCTSLTARFYC
jgi:hypothetical protein